MKSPPAKEPPTTIDDYWNAWVVSPDNLEQAPETPAPIPHAEDVMDGARFQRFQFTDLDLQRYFQGQDPYTRARPPVGGGADEDGGGGGDVAAVAGGGSREKERDLLTLLCHSSELAVEIGKYLRPADIVTLYSISRAFHDAINNYMSASVRAWIAHQASEAGRVFDFRLYKRHLVADPAGRTWGYQYEAEGGGQQQPSTAPAADDDAANPPQHRRRRRRPIDAAKAGQVRAVPGLKYLQLVVGRDRCCRDMRAVLARNGHRTPASMHATLLRLWLCLDIPTGAQRAALLRNRDVWRDTDLYNAQMLFVKLGMHFNDPIYGPNTYELLHLMMGQRGLYPLWQLLLRKRFTRLAEVLALKVRYDFPVAPAPPAPLGADGEVGGGGGEEEEEEWEEEEEEQGEGDDGGGGGGGYDWTQEFFGSSIHGVPYDEIGRAHLEGWGQGQRHLLRPDELVPVEAVARGLELDAHLMAMMLWGYMDWTSTGANLVPTAEEMYMSGGDDDDEGLGGGLSLAHADTSHHWRARHVLKKRWEELTPAERRRIRHEDEDERLRAMAWCGEAIDDYSSASEDSNDDDDDNDDAASYSLEDEITRGYIVPPQRPGVVVPGLDDRDGWTDFVNDVMTSGLLPDISGQEATRAEAWQSYQDVEVDSDWDWGLWLRQQERQRQQRRDRSDAGSDGEDEDDDDDDDNGVGSDVGDDVDSEATTAVEDIFAWAEEVHEDSLTDG